MSRGRLRIRLSVRSAGGTEPARGRSSWRLNDRPTHAMPLRSAWTARQGQFAIGAWQQNLPLPEVRSRGEELDGAAAGRMVPPALVRSGALGDAVPKPLGFIALSQKHERRKRPQATFCVGRSTEEPRRPGTFGNPRKRPRRTKGWLSPKRCVNERIALDASFFRKCEQAGMVRLDIKLFIGATRKVFCLA